MVGGAWLVGFRNVIATSPLNARGDSLCVRMAAVEALLLEQRTRHDQRDAKKNAICRVLVFVCRTTMRIDEVNLLVYLLPQRLS